MAFPEGYKCHLVEPSSYPLLDEHGQIKSVAAQSDLFAGVTARMSVKDTRALLEANAGPAPLVKELLSRFNAEELKRRLFLGVDLVKGYPYLYALGNPEVGPLLIASPNEEEINRYMQFISHTIEYAQSSHEVGFAVITSNPESWQTNLNDPYFLGFFQPDVLAEQDLKAALARPSQMPELLESDNLEMATAKPAVSDNFPTHLVLFIEDLNGMLQTEPEVAKKIGSAIENAPMQNIHIVAGYNYGKLEMGENPWEKLFRTHVVCDWHEPQEKGKNKTKKKTENEAPVPNYALYDQGRLIPFYLPPEVLIPKKPRQKRSLLPQFI